MSRADSPLHERMIFSFGAQRSGTFWLQRIVAAHPAVAAVPSETALFSEGIGPLFERFHHGLRSSTTVSQTYVDREVLLDATRDFCDSVLVGHLTPGARYLAERSPMHVHHVDLISAVYPDARLVHIIRDGRDVARSLVAREWGPATIAEAAEQWRSAVVDARAAGPGDHYREVRYEDLLDDPATAIADLYDWLGLEHDEAIMADAVTEAGVQGNQDATDPTPRRDKWRDHFTAEDLRAFDEVGGALLAELGYARDDAAAAPAHPSPQDARGEVARPGRGARAKAAAGRLAGRRDTAPPEPAESSIDEVGGALAGAQEVVDRLLGAIHGDRLDDVPGLVAPNATIRLIAAEGEVVGRGPQALVEQLRDDPAWRGRQVRGDMHPGVPTYSVVLSYELPDGVRADRVLQLAIRKRVARAVTIYRLPLS